MHIFPSEMKRALSLFIFLIASASICFSQHYVDLARIEYNYGLPQSFKDTSSTGNFSELTLDLLAPIVINDRIAIVTGTLLERTDVSISLGKEVSLYGNMLKLGDNIKHSKKCSGSDLILPKLSSDLKQIRKRDFQIGALALIKQHFDSNPNFNYRFGIYANTDLYAYMIVPIVGVYLLKNKWEIKAALPINAEVNRQFGSHVKIGARFDGINKSYYLNDGSNQYLEKVNNEVGMFARLMFGNYHFQLIGGHSLGRSFRTYTYGDRFDLTISAIKINNQRTIQNQDFKNGPVLRFSFIYRLPKQSTET